MVLQARSFWNRPRWRAFTLLAVVLPTLTACMTLEAVIRVNPDGSGTLERTFIATNDLLVNLLSELEDAEICSDEASLGAAAAAMGDGVRLSSAEAIDTERGPGCRAVLEFDDINGLDFELDPIFLIPSGLAEAMGEAPSEEYSEDLLHFRFEPGDPATLFIEIEQGWDEEGDASEEEGEEEVEEEDQGTDEVAEVADEDEEEDEFARAAGRAAMRSMLGGSRFAVTIEVAGSIVESDASHVDGNKVTIMEVDFDELLDSGRDLEDLFESEPGSAAEMRALMAQVEGVTVETAEAITIRFRAPGGF